MRTSSDFVLVGSDTDIVLRVGSSGAEYERLYVGMVRDKDVSVRQAV